MRRSGLVILIAAVGLSLPVVGPASPAAAAPIRAFSDESWWNTPLPPAAPIHPDSAEIMSWLKGDNNQDSVRVAGTSSTGEWGMPIFWAEAGDKEHDVISTGYSLPPEFDALRIPADAQPDPSNDAAITIWDVERGYVSAMYEAEYVSDQDQWKAGGGAIYYLGSNGLVGSLPEADEPRNRGHRGVPPSAFAVRYDEIQAGVIDHVLKVAVNTTKAEFVWPMTGHENGTTATYAPPEGTRIRIKPSFDLSSVDLSPAARTIATALQRYGAVIGDQSGGNVVLKVENTVAQGDGWLWDGLLSADSLGAIPLHSFDVVEHGYKPPTGSGDGGSGDGGSDDGGLGEEPVPAPDVDIKKPNKKKIRDNRVRIVWDSEGTNTWAKLLYKVEGGGTKSIQKWTHDDGSYWWKIPSKLDDKRFRIKVWVYDWATGLWGWDVSRWTRLI